MVLFRTSILEQEINPVAQNTSAAQVTPIGLALSEFSCFRHLETQTKTLKLHHADADKNQNLLDFPSADAWCEWLFGARTPETRVGHQCKGESTAVYPQCANCPPPCRVPPLATVSTSAIAENRHFKKMETQFILLGCQDEFWQKVSHNKNAKTD